MQIADLYAVEWNLTLNQFHVTAIGELISANVEVLQAGRPPEEADWLVVAVEPTYDAAHIRLKALRASLDAPPPIA
jgi:hypothetical protein